jgi:holo-[acyl-carrier protein] synthase
MLIGLGIDVIQNERIAQSLERFGERFISRIFTEGETAYCQAAARPAIHFAVRFAAKEAAFKALGTGWAKGVRWRDVDIHRLASGQPELHLHGEALNRATSLGANRFFVSLTHDQTVSAAVVVLESSGTEASE